jgi:hypothetical protein
MSEQQEIILPTDSVSSAGGKKRRPGKQQRQMAKSAVTSQTSATTGIQAVPNANNFARKAYSDPVPQPGKYPVVFQTGAGEPTQDSFFALSGESLSKAFLGLPDYYSAHAKYSEYAANLGEDSEDFFTSMVVSSLLGLTQQIVHAHVNMGLPMGDFSSISSTDIFNPASVRAVIHQFGEFSVHSLGTRFLLKSYDDEVSALVRTAKRVLRSDGRTEVRRALNEHWLPVTHGDKRTRFILAYKLSQRFERYGIFVPVGTIYDGLYQEMPAAVIAAKQLLPDEEVDLYDGLFSAIGNHARFKAIFQDRPRTPTAEGAGAGGGEYLGSRILSNLGLRWDEVAEHKLEVGFSAKVEFPELAMGWLRKKASIVKFFSCGSGLSEKSTACGMTTQLAEVSSVSGITVVRNLVAASADEFSLCACFPPSGFFDFPVMRNVVLSTPLVPKVRAAEFAQLSWL